MTPTAVILLLLQILLILLLIVWWLRWSSRGLEWVTLFLFAAIGMSHLSSLLFRVPPYRAGCDGLCPGWQGYPFPTHHIETGGIVVFDPVSFVRNAFFYYAIILAYAAVIAWLGRQINWRGAAVIRRLSFIILIIMLPLATLPLWLPPPQPEFSGSEQRLVINAARDWRWQLHLRGFMERTLAAEDVRTAPDDVHQRVCFRIYTWFYLPYARAYIDLDETGVRAMGGAEIPLSESCWTQP
jgi:hypothetical protein